MLNPLFLVWSGIMTDSKNTVQTVSIIGWTGRLGTPIARSFVVRPEFATRLIVRKGGSADADKAKQDLLAELKSRGAQVRCGHLSNSGAEVAGS